MKARCCLSCCVQDAFYIVLSQATFHYVALTGRELAVYTRQAPASQVLGVQAVFQILTFTNAQSLPASTVFFEYSLLLCSSLGPQQQKHSAWFLLQVPVFAKPFTTLLPLFKMYGSNRKETRTVLHGCAMMHMQVLGIVPYLSHNLTSPQKSYF